MAWDRSRGGARGAWPARPGSPTRSTTSLYGFDGIVVSPGRSAQPPSDRRREPRRRGVPLIGDIELFAQARPTLPPHKVVGITGTNGKSTTTALVHHIVRSAGIPTTMGGNIGLPILGQEPLPGRAASMCSSFPPTRSI